MKANRKVSRPASRWNSFGAMGVLALAAASCSPPRVVPAPQPTQTPSPVRPAPAEAPANWMDAPITPGNWTWSMEHGQSVARFAGNRLVLRCDRAGAAVRIEQASSAGEAVPMTVQTETTRRTLSAAASSSLPGTVSAIVTARDPLLDAMAFSRGRFAVFTAQEPALFVPSWPEVSRVIEDCR